MEKKQPHRWTKEQAIEMSKKALAKRRACSSYTSDLNMAYEMDKRIMKLREERVHPNKKLSGWFLIVILFVVLFLILSISR